MAQKLVLRGLFGGGVILLLILSVVGYWGATSVYFEAVSHFKLQYFVLGLCAFFFFVLTRQLRWTIVSLVLVLVNLAVLVPWYVPDSVPNAARTAPIRLLFANVYVNNMEYDRLKSIIRRERPDLIALAEVTPAWQEALTDLEPLYPYSLAGVGPGQSGMLMYSSRPLTPLSDIDALGISERKILGATVTWEGISFAAIAVHPRPPIGPDLFEERNRFLATVGGYVRDRTAPVVVIGDFNVSLWSPIHQQFSHISGLRNARRGFGILPTWPAHQSLLFIPIDHCFISQDVDVRNFRTGASIGSDHLPILAELSLPQS